MRNPLAVFLFSLDHKSTILNKIFRKIRLYDAIAPFPFEHYCVFCAKNVSNEWWYPKSYFINREKERKELLRLAKIRRLKNEMLNT